MTETMDGVRSEDISKDEKRLEEGTRIFQEFGKDVEETLEKRKLIVY